MIILIATVQRVRETINQMLFQIGRTYNPVHWWFILDYRDAYRKLQNFFFSSYHKIAKL